MKYLHIFEKRLIDEREMRSSYLSEQFLSQQHMSPTIVGFISGFIAELRRAKRASGAPWVRSFGKSSDARNFG